MNNYENNQFLIFDHIEGIELFKLKQYEDFREKIFEDYMSLLEIVSHVSSCKKELSFEWLKVNDVKDLHCDKSYISQKMLFSENGINIIIGQCNNIFRGIRVNLHRFLKKKFSNEEILKSAHEFSRKIISEPNNDSYLVNIAAEVENIKEEIKVLDELCIINDSYIHRDQSYESTLNILKRKKAHLLELEQKLDQKVQLVAPRLKEVLRSDLLVGRMIHKAGSLKNLALFPASTIQLLGAEKALFSSIKTKAPNPKHGDIIFNAIKDFYNDDNINPRVLGNKCSIAAKIDAYSGHDDVLNK